MHRPNALRALPLLLIALAPALAALPAARTADAAPAIGFVQKFDDGTTGLWASNDVLTNPGTGGAGGAGDGYLNIATSVAFHLGARADSSAYVGDWIAAGVNRVRFRLEDTGAPQSLEIHFGLGNGSDFWQSNLGFVPPASGWAQFTVDLTDSSQFTQIIAFSPGFTQALRATDRILLRHDKAPFAQSPDNIAGDFGVDNVELTSTLVDVAPPPGAAVARPVELAAPFPNPARGGVALAFEVFDGAPVHVAVVDARGRIVRAETLAGTTPGRRSWVWDGRDERGAAAPAGAYRARVVGEAGGMSRPFVLLR